MSYNPKGSFVHGRLWLRKLCIWVGKADVVEGEFLLLLLELVYST